VNEGTLQDIGAPGTGTDAGLGKPDERSAAERIASAKEQARAAREAAGLPAVDDGPFSAEALRARRKRKR
jgi:hypothetical protein